MKPQLALVAAAFALRVDAFACETDAELDFLIGEWATGDAAAAPSFIQRYEWGPDKSYIWTETAFPAADGTEHLHFAGMIVWNAKTAAHDYLFVVEPGSGARESGAISRNDDGVVIRSVELVDKAGAQSIFRQRFECRADGVLTTSLERRLGDEWTPTFPGSIDLVMTKIVKN